MTRSTSDVAVCCCSDSQRSSRALAQLVQQPRVLDGDDGLVGEGSEPARSACPYTAAASILRKKDYSDNTSFTQERNGERRPITANLLRIVSGVIRISQHIRYMNKASLDCRSSDHTPLINRYWIGFHVFMKFRCKPIARGSAV